MAGSYERPSTPRSSLPQKPKTSSHQQGSLRKTIQRKRSVSPVGSGSEVASGAASDAGSTSSSSKKAKHERSSKPSTPGGPPSLLSRALTGAKEAAETAVAAVATTPSASTSTPRAQFEQQEDFISFDFDDEPKASPKPRFTPGGGRGGRDAGASGSKRKLDEYEERDAEGTRRMQKRERERSTPWCEEPGVDWSKCNSAIDMVNREAFAFIHYISPTPVEHELRLWTIELIRRTIQKRWSDADVQCFGSVGTGLYLPGGDIDLVVLCPTMPSPPLKPSSSLLHRLASLLLTSSLAEPSSLVVIAKARVPIVKFVTRYGGFSVDLSVNQKNGVDAAVRVRGMLEEFAFREEAYVEPGVEKKKSKKGKGKEVASPPVAVEEDINLVDQGVARSLVMLVKAFLNQRGMNEVFTGGLGSYSIICLVISFLQLHPKIQTGEINPHYNIGLLFVEFLEYYGKHFNFDEAGITLRGRGGYFNKHDKGWWRANQPYLLSIEDPNDPSNDVSGGSHNIIRVRQTLSGAYDVLAATLSHRVSHFEALHNSSTLPLNGSVLPNADIDAPTPLCQSILGAIIGMSRSGIRAREENVRLYDEGVLQALLEQSGAGGEIGGTSKKALKKLRKEEREKKKRDKTVARLEMRQEEREAKQERKERKKKELEAGLAPKAGASTSTSAAASTAGDDEDPGFIIDVVGETPAGDPVARKLFPDASAAHDLADEEESRYAIASPAPSTSASAAYKSRNAISDAVAKAKALEPIFVHGSDSDYSSDEGDHDDEDVWIGGGTGDLLNGPKATSKEPAQKKQKQAIALDSSSSEGSGDEEVLSYLVPPKAKGKEMDAKKQAKAAFWASKGKVEEGGEWDS
ncbi:hypothetical protein BCR35DRAFT_294786 [Leucosporidium creatinivorum]|uniref:polynucleotide adenylyltransferase n=1 Tax=Leucosporidium creatinivorum TaxID=106004 RepID=A0A1Y2E8N9_9BASI|nr:hypothetical protein BCR35DRAFT_294786 [Leucosporidium creatinivorum]